MPYFPDAAFPSFEPPLLWECGAKVGGTYSRFAVQNFLESFEKRDRMFRWRRERSLEGTRVRGRGRGGGY